LRIWTKAAVVGATVSLVAFAIGAPASATTRPQIIGGQPTTQPYPGMASLQVRQPDGTYFPECGAVLVNPYYVVTGAHCVTDPDASVVPASDLQLRVGSADRTNGGVLVGVTKVLPNAHWNSGPGPVGDIAMLKLARPVFNAPFLILPADAAKPARVIGWGSNQFDGGGTYPTVLQQADTRLLPNSSCAAAGIGAGELCIDDSGGSGVCVGDSGGPVMQQVLPGIWGAIATVSRGAGGGCGDAVIVVTNLAYYSSWILQVTLTGMVPPAT
jgi:secreted trypsin-like serine protease